MSEQLSRERQPFVRADFSHYPNITSDDGEYMVSNGYVYAKIHNSDGSDKQIAGRPVYQRLHQSQTYPTKVPELCSHEEVREWLLGEARSILNNLQSGKLKAEMSFRFRRCVYDERGLFVEMMQGGTGYNPLSREQAAADYKAHQQAQAYSDMPKSQDDYLDWTL